MINAASPSRLPPHSAFRSTFSCVREQLLEVHRCPSDDLAQLEPLIMLLYSQTVIPGVLVDFDEIFEGFEDTNVVSSVHLFLFPIKSARAFCCCGFN